MVVPELSVLLREGCLNGTEAEQFRTIPPGVIAWVSSFDRSFRSQNIVRPGVAVTLAVAVAVAVAVAMGRDVPEVFGAGGRR